MEVILKVFFTNLFYKLISQTHAVNPILVSASGANWSRSVYLVQVMAWCCQATSHYLSQCWLGYLSPYGIARPQWVKTVPLSHQTPHDDVIKWKHFPRYWPFVRGIHRSPVNSPHKGQWRRALMFTLIYARINRLSKQSWGWWFEMLSRPLWRHRNVIQW